MKTQSLFSTITTVVVGGMAFLFPLAFLPFTSDFYELNKHFLWFGAVFILAILFFVRAFLTKKIELQLNRWLLAMLLLIVATGVSIVVAAPNRVMALSGNGGFLIALPLFFILASSLLKNKVTTVVTTGLLTAGVVITLVSLLEQVGIRFLSVASSAFRLQLPENTRLFLTGGAIVNVFFLLVLFVMMLVKVVNAKSFATRLPSALLGAIMLLGVVLNGLLVLPGRDYAPSFLPFLSSWSIALDVSKTPLLAVVGVGPDSFTNAFTLYRPAALNQTTQWFLSYSTARNLPLTVFTTTGALGLIAWTLLALTFIRTMKSASKDDMPLVAGIGAIMVIFLLFPPTATLLGVLFLLITALNMDLHNREDSQSSSVEVLDVDKTPQGAVAIVRGTLYALIVFGFVATFALLYFAGKTFASELTFGQAMAALRRNDAQPGYDQSVAAIQLNPYNDSFHRSFALTNLAFAQAITQKQTLSDQEKNTVVTLIQQAISEGKAAVSLDQSSAANWDALTSIYKALIGSVDQADQWTVAAYVQSIQHDPSNPALRLNLAGVFRQAKNDDQAAQLLSQAVQLKPDYANAYFNLADIYKEQGKKQEEYDALAQTLQLIDQKDQNYAQIQERATVLQKELQEAAAKQQEAATDTAGKTATATPTPRPTATPAATPTPEPQAQLNLPTDAGLANPSAIPEVPAQP